MEARLVTELPDEPGWQYEPKWDGFRCLAVRAGKEVALYGKSGKPPGGPSRWSNERSSQWEPLAPKLVVEVRYDHVTGERFRHGTRLLRWRPDKSARQCTFEQLR